MIIQLLAVFARSESGEDLTTGVDRKIINTLKKELRPYGIRLLNFKSQNDRDQFHEASEKGADEFIITIDAQDPMHPAFFRTAELFLRDGGRRDPRPFAPYLLVTNADAEEACRKLAADSIRDVWLTRYPDLSDYQCEYPVIYCSKDYKHFSLDGEHYKEGIDVIVQFLEATHEQWARHRGQF